KVKIFKKDQIDQFLVIMLFELSSSLFIKNYISIQNLLNNAKTIENQHKNMFYYYFCFNRNKQIVIFIIINKFLIFIETICMNYIFSVLIISTSTFSALFSYLN